MHKYVPKPRPYSHPLTTINGPSAFVPSSIAIVTQINDGSWFLNGFDTGRSAPHRKSRRGKSKAPGWYSLLIA